MKYKNCKLHYKNELRIAHVPTLIQSNTETNWSYLTSRELWWCWFIKKVNDSAFIFSFIHSEPLLQIFILMLHATAACRHESLWIAEDRWYISHKDNVDLEEKITHTRSTLFYFWSVCSVVAYQLFILVSSWGIIIVLLWSFFLLLGSTSAGMVSVQRRNQNRDQFFLINYLHDNIYNILNM